MSDALTTSCASTCPRSYYGDSIPALSERGLVITAPDVLGFGDGRKHRLPGYSAAPARRRGRQAGDTGATRNHSG